MKRKRKEKKRKEKKRKEKKRKEKKRKEKKRKKRKREKRNYEKEKRRGRKEGRGELRGARGPGDRERLGPGAAVRRSPPGERLRLTALGSAGLRGYGRGSAVQPCPGQRPAAHPRRGGHNPAAFV
ncbi:hypothetical protein AAES_130152 [Amazona aestiva]|uniref:Uncharacterized protein n=1 Tax=Amazona aestiva TaxID=12930 RepID=A0A0Q3P7U8_AMAAE|nr:hypothetical protein AAES_130152 [Amazona aestiva]